MSDFETPRGATSTEPGLTPSILRVMELCLWAQLAGGIGVVVIALVGDDTFALWGASAVTAATPALLWMLRHGRVRGALVGAVCVLLTVACVEVGIGHGIHDIGIIIFPILILVSALLLDPWTAVVLSGLCVVCLTGIGVAEATGVLDTGFAPGVDPSDVAIVALMLGVFSVIVHSLTRALYRGLREAEESARQLREAEKLHAVGQLAGGVAHDFNNQLTAILGSAERLRARVGADPELSGAVQDIIQCSTRAADLTRQLLAFARKEPHRRDVVTVDPLVDEVVSLLRRGADKRVTIQTRLQAGESGRVLGDVSLLQNALLNLGLNACDAMSRGGCLTFETRCLGRAEIDDGLRTRLQEASRRAGGGGDAAAVCVRVVDDGEGMPPEVAERAFEPFFTTKERGTGMGLAASYGTVEAHGGAITIDSEPGRGTTVEVLLPATERPVEESIAPRASAPPPAVRVLLAEDEPAVGRSIVATLEALGCQVCWCKDGPETIERFAEDPEAFEVAMLDHAMPQMLGSDVAVRLAELRPGLPIVSVSGFRDGPDGSRAGPRQVFLPKPFTMEQLESALQRALAGRGRA